ncbi:hypothetical protein BGC07_06095 [Piscirickettsia litoralis]|uniref:Uncharacterized protein n=1 Tax=Piscirickettsia litoralis TaxID=1891921 RepID=A0ABX3A148_9GAMM|nr:hypothetical protein BGC07_06095 [Piscirickettsia litoralis]
MVSLIESQYFILVLPASVPLKTYLDINFYNANLVFNNFLVILVQFYNMAWFQSIIFTNRE